MSAGGRNGPKIASSGLNCAAAGPAADTPAHARMMTENLNRAIAGGVSQISTQHSARVSAG
jgi:hypothetical protein